jgi:hypothetical protein
LLDIEKFHNDVMELYMEHMQVLVH